MAAPSSRPSIDSTNHLSPILSPSASHQDLSAAYPPRSSSARPVRPRRGSTASSIFSLNSSVGTALDWRTSKDFTGGQGGPSSTAISSLLEAPGARSTSAARPKPGDIPPVTLTQIPKLRPSVFAPYLSISSDYDRYRRAKGEGLEDFVRRSSSLSVKSPTPSIADAEDGTVRGSPIRLSRARKASLAVTPLSTVPSVYFDDNFHLENPRTFDVVSERSEVIRSQDFAKDDGSENQASSSRKALATNAILQEKLSWYMDTVEVHLISSISTASPSFFAALGDLRQLHSEAAASVQKIHGLRRELVRLDEEQAVKGLEIVRLRRRRDNVSKLERAVKQMERVIKCLQSVEMALNQQEFDDACDRVQETERLIAGEGEEGLLDLRGVKALEAVSADLNHLRFRIGKAFESRFVDCLLTDLRKHVEKVPSTETLRRFAQSFQRDLYQRSLPNQENNPYPPRSSSLPPEYTVISENLRSQLRQHLEGLQRVKHVNNGVQAYRDAVIKEAKNLVRRNMPSDDDADSVMSSVSRISRSGGVRSSADKSMALSRALRSLGPADAEDVLVRMYTGVSELVRRLGMQQKMLLDVTMQMGETGVGGMLSPRLEQNGFGPISNGPASSSDRQPDVVPMDISDLISAAVEISQRNIVKVVKVRSEQVAQYPPDMFVRYVTLNRLFAQECEAVSVRVGSGLQSAVSGQIKEFLSVYQEDQRNALAERLEKDKWEAKEFDDSKQKGIDRILEAATRDPDDWLSIGRLWELRQQESQPNSVETPAVNGTNGTSQGTPAETKAKTYAMVDGQKFILPESSIEVLRVIETYESLIAIMPSLTSELASGMIDVLKLFNSRMFGLILGAGAVKSAGLRTIQTKHMALASLALSILITLIPYIREFVRRHMPPPPAGGRPPDSLLVDFDKLKRTAQEYQEEIHGKLTTMMSDRLQARLKIMRRMDWNKDESAADPAYYMNQLCKDTTTLHKVLSKHFPQEQLLAIMRPIFADYQVRLVEAYNDAAVTTEEGKEKMIRDVTTFRDRLEKLEGFGNTGEIVLEAVRNKIITEPPTPSAASSVPRTNGASTPRPSNGDRRRDSSQPNGTG